MVTVLFFAAAFVAALFAIECLEARTADRQREAASRKPHHDGGAAGEPPASTP